MTVTYLVRGTLTLDRLVDQPAPELAFLRLPDGTSEVSCYGTAVVVVERAPA